MPGRRLPAAALALADSEGGSVILQGTGEVTGDPARIGPSEAQVTAEGGEQRLHLEVVEE